MGNYTESDDHKSNVVPNKALPSLPEPTVPPPPPPLNTNIKQFDDSINEQKCTPSITSKANPEPIYEAVIITNDSENKDYKEPETPPFETSNINQQNNLKNEVNICSSVSTKTLNIGNVMQYSRDVEVNSEREQRRKYRVEKKILEMHQNTADMQKDLYNNDVHYDIMEFAEHYFNTHERTPEGTIIATLTRKNKKNVDHIPKYEMITFYKGDRISTSHIHMYDPENVVLACNIFRVSIQ